MITTRARLVPQNQLVYDQVDLLENDGFTRVTGITVPHLDLVVFFNNVVQPWPLVNGASVTDGLAVSGSVYFNEIPGSPGYYNVRWRPNALGSWRIVLTYTTGQQIEAHDFEVVASNPGTSSMTASFIKPTC